MVRITHSLLAYAAALGLLAATPAFASTLIIEQRSDVATYGEWTLTPPSGAVISSYRQEQKRVISSAPSGGYTVHVRAPEGAITTIRLLEGDTTRQSVTGERLTFTLGSDALATLQIAYTYHGAVKIESIPTGAGFDLSGPSLRFTGTTPATINDLPPLYYTANFHLRDGCTPPKPIKRSLGANQTIVFLGEYLCGEAASRSSTSRSPVSRSSSSGSASENAVGKARVVQAVQQQEVLPGGTVRVTVGMVNTGRSTLRNLTVSEQLSSLLVVQDAGGAVQSGDLLLWEIPELFAGQRWSTSFTATVQDTAQPGDRLTLTARAAGDDLDGTPIEQLVASSLLGIAVLPPTGTPLDILFALLGLLLPIPVTARVRRQA
jgi:hypothetical protein